MRLAQICLCFCFRRKWFGRRRFRQNIPESELCLCFLFGIWIGTESELCLCFLFGIRIGTESELCLCFLFGIRIGTALSSDCPTGWLRVIGCLIFIRHFPQKSPIIVCSFAKYDIRGSEYCRM